MPCPLGANRQIVSNNSWASLCVPEDLSPDESGLGKAGALRHIMADWLASRRDGSLGQGAQSGPCGRSVTARHRRRASRNWLGR